MGHDRTGCFTKNAAGYTGVLSAEALRAWVTYSAGSCRQKQPARIRRCARTAMRALVCPCAWTEQCITDAVECELLYNEMTRRGSSLRSARGNDS